MGKSFIAFLAFAATLVIQFFSMLIVSVIAGILCFGRYAIFHVRSPAGYQLVTLLQLLASFVPSIIFLRMFQQKSRGTWSVWIGGCLAMGMIAVIYLGFMSFHMH